MDGINWSIYLVERQVQQELVLKVKKWEKAELKLKLFTLKKGKEVTWYNFFYLLTFHIHHSADIISLKLCMFDVDSLRYSNSGVKSFQPPLTGHWQTDQRKLRPDGRLFFSFWCFARVQKPPPMFARHRWISYFYPKYMNTWKMNFMHGETKAQSRWQTCFRASTSRGPPIWSPFWEFIFSLLFV